jgi:hypothetical protein
MNWSRESKVGLKFARNARSLGRAVPKENLRPYKGSHNEIRHTAIHLDPILSRDYYLNRLNLHCPAPGRLTVNFLIYNDGSQFVGKPLGKPVVIGGRTIGAAQMRETVQNLDRMSRIRRRWLCGGALTSLLANFLLGFGCESQRTPSSTDAAARKQDLRSPRIRKRDSLHPEGPPKNSQAARGRQK